MPKLVLVEDDPDTAELIIETLVDHFGGPCVQHYPTVTEAREADLTEVDLVLSDMNLPDGSGMDVLMHVLEHWADKPVVLVTGEGILDNALDAIRRGAYDYVVKAGDYLFAIPIVVEKNLELFRVKQHNTELMEQLRKVAATDPLTGLSNRRAFSNALERRFAESVRHDEDLACIMLDLDGFKQLNDKLGHPTGDRVLQQVGRVLEANCRQMDVAARFGGDEFVVVLPQIDVSRAKQVATRISEEFALAMSCELDDDAPRVTMSMGLATLAECKPAHSEQLIKQADQALYHVKAHGKDNVSIYTPAMQDAVA